MIPVFLWLFATACLQRPKQQQFLLLVERQTESLRQIYTVHPDGSDLTQRIEFDVGNLFWLSPDGKYLAIFTRGQKGISDLPARMLTIIELLSGDTIGMIEQVGNTLSEHLPHYEEVVWSPNGEKLVFIKDSGGGQGTDLWVYVLETGLSRSLTADEGLEWSPVWSGDGEQLAFAALEPCDQSVWNCPPSKQIWNIVAMNDDGSNRRIIANLHDNQLLQSDDTIGAWLTHLLCDLSWSAENGYITFGDHCGWQPGLWYGASAFVANTDNHHIQSLTNFVDIHAPESTLYLDSITNYSIQWSNLDDDMFMGYTRLEVKPDGHTYNGILIVNTDDYSFTTVNDGLGQIGASAIWSPNGQYVVGLINSDTQESALSGTTLIAGAWDNQRGTVLSISEQLPKGSYDHREIYWSPDGRSFAYTLTESTNNERGIAVVTLPDGPVTSILGSLEEGFRPIGWASADDIQP